MNFLIAFVLITCFVANCEITQSDSELPTTTEMGYNTEFQPILNGGLFPLPGDIPVLNRRIVRGVRVTVNEHPYMTSIRRCFSHYSTGVIIARNLILTVAHPLDNVPIYELGVVVGESYNDRGSAIRPVILIIVHEKFDPYTLAGDLAIIRLHYNLIYRVNTKPVLGLVPPNKDPISKNVMVTGWGRCDLTGKELCLPRSTEYYPDEKMDPMLKNIAVKLPSSRVWGACNLLYKNLFGTPLTSKMICLGYLRAQFPSAPCMAVPGAPALVDAKLLGLQSWGFGCGYKNDMPVIYTDVRKYYKWIYNTTRILHEITQADLTSLYHLTVGKRLYDWFSKTRSQIPDMANLSTEIQTQPFDSQLAKIRGKTYDIRDYVLGGAFQELKQETYKRHQESANYDEEIKKLKTEFNHTSDSEEIEPFIHYTIPTPDSEDSDSA